MAGGAEVLSGRLESPMHLVRRMASSVALVFSKVVDPKNPLYLDDSFNGETIDWEFGFSTQSKGISSSLNGKKEIHGDVKISSITGSNKEVDNADARINTKTKRKNKKLSDFSPPIELHFCSHFFSFLSGFLLSSD